MANKTFNTILSILIFLLVTTPYTKANIESSPKPIEKKIDIVVEAMVYCQSCDHIGSWSLTGAKPIPLAKASVTCKNYKGQVSYYKVFETDKNGYLYAQLEGFKMQHYLLDHPLHSCYVKLVWSPIESCGLLSNVNYSLNGASLRYENKKLHGNYGYEAVVYAAGPLAFRPSHCEDAATHDHN